MFSDILSIHWVEYHGEARLTVVLFFWASKCDMEKIDVLVVEVLYHSHLNKNIAESFRQYIKMFERLLRIFTGFSFVT